MEVEPKQPAITPQTEAGEFTHEGARSDLVTALQDAGDVENAAVSDLLTQLTPQAELDTAWQEWRTTRDPTRAKEILDRLNPAINAALSRIGGADNPILRSNARLVALEALNSYEPGRGASLGTWTSQQLMRLNRMNRSMSTPVPLPDAAWLDHMKLEKAAREFEDEHGREPDLDELADLTQLSKKRIGMVRSTVRKMASEAAFGGAAMPDTTAPDYQVDEAVDAVYADADRIDKQILEMRTGYGGKFPEPLGLVEIAAAVGMDPASVHRRAARLHMRIQQVKNDMEEVYGRPG